MVANQKDGGFFVQFSRNQTYDEYCSERQSKSSKAVSEPENECLDASPAVPAVDMIGEEAKESIFTLNASASSNSIVQYYIDCPRMNKPRKLLCLQSTNGRSSDSTMHDVGYTCTSVVLARA